MLQNEQHDGTQLTLQAVLLRMVKTILFEGIDCMQQCFACIKIVCMCLCCCWRMHYKHLMALGRLSHRAVCMHAPSSVVNRAYGVSAAMLGGWTPLSPYPTWTDSYRHYKSHHWTSNTGLVAHAILGACISGLDINKDVIIEIAVLVTDGDLKTVVEVGAHAALSTNV